MSNIDTGKYSIGKFCELAGGISSRTVRYYVQETILPPPVGRGRSTYYTDVHVSRVLLIRDLQGRGWSIPAIREYLIDPVGHDPSKIPAIELPPILRDGKPSSYFGPTATTRQTSPESARMVTSDVRRSTGLYEIVQGVMLVVDRQVEESDGRNVREAVRVLKTIFPERAKKD